MRLVDTLPVRRTPRAGGEAATTVKQPVELASMSKFRERTVYDRRNLKPLAVPALPVDLNHGFERFVDRDRNNAYPAPLNTITGALASAGHEEELSKANFVTWRWVCAEDETGSRGGACGSLSLTHPRELPQQPCDHAASIGASGLSPS
jgi:hypothetical protein